MGGDLGKAEVEHVSRFVTPIYWVIPQGQGVLAKNGTLTFLDTGNAIFGVTAAHVILEYQHDAKIKAGPLQFGIETRIELSERLIACDADMDIATLRVTPEEIKALGKYALGGHAVWPPSPPQPDKGVYYTGFPGAARYWERPGLISFGLMTGGGVATSVNERDISSQHERENWVDVRGQGLPPEGFNYGGLSGGPMITVVEHNGIRRLRLGGLIYQGSNTDGTDQCIEGMEVIKARRADFILEDGRLDRTRWDHLSY